MIYKKNESKGFTLVELLTIMAVIGLLASIVLISVKGSREKAEEKKNMQFSASIYHSLGAYAIGIWHFDGNLDDSSGNNIQLSWDGEEKYVNGIINQALDFSEGGTVYGYSDKLTHESGVATVEFWTYINSCDETYMPLISTGSFPYECFIYGENTQIYCYIIDNDSNETSFYADIPGLKKWLHVVVSYDGKGNARMFLNNKEISPTLDEASEKIFATGYLGMATLSYSCDFYMDELRIYDSYISLSEIQKHYAEGLMRIGLAEYNKVN